jgi:hypothetical protein
MQQARRKWYTLCRSVCPDESITQNACSWRSLFCILIFDSRILHCLHIRCIFCILSEQKISNTESAQNQHILHIILLFFRITLSYYSTSFAYCIYLHILHFIHIFCIFYILFTVWHILQIVLISDYAYYKYSLAQWYIFFCISICIFCIFLWPAYCAYFVPHIWHYAY